MCCVDLFDQFVSTYRVCIRSEMVVACRCMGGKRFNGKCMEPFFHSVQNQKIGMLDFQREVVMTILASFGRNKPAMSLAFP